MTKVATVILTWNGREDTLECLASVVRSEHRGWENHVVVVDNSSADGTAEAVEAAFPDVVVIRNADNIGFAEGNNQGIEWAVEHGMDYVLLLNNDTVVEPSAFARLVREAERRPEAGAVMPLIRFYAARDTVWYAGGDWVEPYGRMQAWTQPSAERPYRTQLFTACCVLIPVRVLEEVGQLDPRFFIYFEDVDLALRFAEAGYETWVVPDAVIYHKVSNSNGGPVSPFALYYQVRNNLLLIRERNVHPSRRAWGYLYMIALSTKIGMNLLYRPIPRKLAVAGAISGAWADFLRQRWGKRN
jgi:GT2 family glycosyltransferase